MQHGWLKLAVQERADARDGVAPLRDEARIELPGVGHPRPHFDFGNAPRRGELLGHPHGIVAQDFVTADLK
jgi:hypothetical protein